VVTRENDKRLETFATILLSLAALSTSWAGYQATLWNGKQARRVAEAGVLRTSATREGITSAQLRLLDVGLFNSWLQERVRGDGRLADYIAARFRPEFKPAFDAWLRTNPLDSSSAASSPFSMPEYRTGMRDSADRLDAAADSVATISRSDKQASDNYVLTAVVLATVMFFATASQQAGRAGPRYALLALAGLACALSVYRLLSLPRA
jgi:hypothetical protein